MINDGFKTQNSQFSTSGSIRPVPMIVAVDGSAGSGKSTVSKALARKLKLKYLDTGAMYRAVTYLALKKNIDLGDETELVKLAAMAGITFENEYMGICSDIYIDGERVTEEIRTPEIDQAVSMVARIGGVRDVMVAYQRRLAGENAVVEGRDIGTVVFPDADVKVFLTASSVERARRRRRDLEAVGHEIDSDTVEDGLTRRDAIDSARRTAPLVKAADAVEIDTTDKSIDEVVAAVAAMVTNAV